MPSDYFKFKTKTKEFIENTNKIINELQGKNILICGNSDTFIELNKQYHFDKNLSISAFANFNPKGKSLKKYGIRMIKPKEIEKENFDCILITDEATDYITGVIMNSIEEYRIKLKCLFIEQYRDAAANLDFLLKHKFKENLVKLEKKLNSKKILFYGGGLFFQLINEYYDLSKLNAIGVVDKKLSEYGKLDNICGYKLYSPEQILDLNPDYVVVTTRRIVKVYEDLYFNYLKGTKIKIIPLVKRSLISIMKEG